jgi:hypothetical protein
MRKTITMMYFSTVAVVLLATIIAQCFLTASEGRSLANTFSYFTIESNILVLVSSAILAIKPTITGTWWRVIRLAALTGITVTGVVYITLLAPYVHLRGIAAVYNAVFHYIIPVTTIVGFFLLDPKYGFRRRDFLFVLWPILWLIYTMIRGAYFHPDFNGFTAGTMQYPYAFLDVSKTSLPGVITAITLVCVLIIGFSAIYTVLDKRKK